MIYFIIINFAPALSMFWLDLWPFLGVRSCLIDKRGIEIDIDIDSLVKAGERGTAVTGDGTDVHAVDLMCQHTAMERTTTAANGGWWPS